MKPCAMRVTRVEGPAEPLLSLTEAYQQLRLDPVFGTSPPSRPDDALIQSCVAAAVDEIDGPNGWLGRCLVTQTLRATLAAFPDGAVMLPFPPLQTVVSVSYTDPDGVVQTLTPDSDYRVIADADVGYMEPAFGLQWPATRRQSDAIKVDFIAGYGAPDEVPELIRQYVRARLGLYYEHREHVITGTIATVIPTIQNVLENYRVRGVLL